MNSLFLNGLYLQWLQFLIEDLAQIHDNALVDFLPQMRSEYLNQRNLECWYLAVHENASQIQLHLETNIDICSINCRTPPQSEPTIGNLVQTGPLRIR